MLPVRPADPLDAERLWVVREAAAAWLVGRGIRQWLPGEVLVEVVAEQVRAGEWFVHEDNGEVVGGLRLLWSDDEVWGAHPDGDCRAGYVHGLVIDRRYAGAAVGKALLAWAEEEVRRAGPALLRPARELVPVGEEH